MTIHNGKAYVPSICASPKGPTSPERNTFPVGTFLIGATLEQDRAAMVQFILSVDESTIVVPPPAAAGADGGSFCAYP